MANNQNDRGNMGGQNMQGSDKQRSTQQSQGKQGSEQTRQGQGKQGDNLAQQGQGKHQNQDEPSGRQNMGQDRGQQGNR